MNLTTEGTVLAVSVHVLGDELLTAANIADVLLYVDDPSDFDENGGTVRIGGDGGPVVDYDSCDHELATLTLSLPLAASWAIGTRVDLYDSARGTLSVEHRALVLPHGELDNDDALDVVIAHALVPLLAEGIREPNTGESVTLTQADNDTEWVITNVVGVQPMIAGELIAPASIARDSLSFTVGTTTATVGAAPVDPAAGDLWFDGANGYAMKVWDGAAWVAYQFSTAAIANGAITPALVSFTARDLGGVTTSFGAVAPVAPLSGDLWYDSANGYRLNRYSGAAWVAVQYGAASIADGSIGTAKISFTARDVGGVTTSIGAVAPVAPLGGDLWYDSANSYRLNRYDGAAWVTVTYGTAALTAGSITAALIAANTITAAQIAAATITGAQLAVDTITAREIGANVITAAEIAATTITAAQIAASTITAAQIAAGTITADRLVAGTLTAAQIAAGTITGDRLAAGTITADLIAVGAIVAGAIAAGALDAMTIRAGTLSAGVLSAGSIGGSAMINSSLYACDLSLDQAGGQVFVRVPVGSKTTTTLTGTGTYTIPAGITLITVEAWGAGGGGEGGRPSGLTHGGAGGEYVRQDIPVVAGHTHAYVVGAGSAGGTSRGSNLPHPQIAAGGSTTFADTYGGKAVTAHGGQGDGPIEAAGGSGSTNTIHFPGGGALNGNNYGGGGSSAGTAQAGNGPGANGLGGIAPTGGGNGGDGNAGTPGANGHDGFAPGGGGGGAGGSAYNGGAGAAGKIVVSYYTSTNLVASISGVSGTDSVSGATYPAGVKIDPKGGGGNDSAWHLVGAASEPAFANSWANYGGGHAGAGFYKDALGFVHLQGLIKSGTVGQPAFTLPAGYRPAFIEIFASPTGGPGVARVDVNGTGTVVVYGVNYGATTGNTTYVALNGITFMAEA